MIGPDGNGEQPDKTVGAVFATEGVTLEVYTLAMVSRVFWPVCVAASRCFGADGPSATMILGSDPVMAWLPVSRKVYNCSGEICARNFKLQPGRHDRIPPLVDTTNYVSLFAGTANSGRNFPVFLDKSQ